MPNSGGFDSFLGFPMGVFVLIFTILIAVVTRLAEKYHSTSLCVCISVCERSVV